MRTAIEAWSGLNLTSHTAEPELVILFTSEKLLFIVFGLAILGLASSLSRPAIAAR